MPVRIVQSKNNARLKELRRAFVRPGQETHGLVAIEGMHLLEEAVRAGLRVACVFLAQESQRLTVNLPVSAETEILIVPRPLLDSVLETDTPQALAALVEMPDWTWAHVLPPPRKGPAAKDRGARSGGGWEPLVLVLAAIQDPGNVGTILRSAEAFGASGIISLPGTVSVWNAKAVRASAGSIFRIPVISATVDETLLNLRESGMRILTTTVHGAEPADMINFTGPVALIIGNEGNGVPDDIASHADSGVTIPCPGPVESLNAAVATSVLLYEACRQRQRAAGGPKQLRGPGR
jgi:RNA methyltransferase, TrmH family